MPRKAKPDESLVHDLIVSCASSSATPEQSHEAVRALCRYYGGTRIYVRARNAELLGVLADAVGDSAASSIMEKIVALYGGRQIYVPQERNAFRKTRALEVHARLGAGGATMRDLAREYGISDTHGYRLWREGRSLKLGKAQTPSLFPELDEIIKRD